MKSIDICKWNCNPLLLLLLWLSCQAVACTDSLRAGSKMQKMKWMTDQFIPEGQIILYPFLGMNNKSIQCKNSVAETQQDQLLFHNHLYFWGFKIGKYVCKYIRMAGGAATMQGAKCSSERVTNVHSHTYTHTAFESNLWFSVVPKDTYICEPETQIFWLVDDL